MNLQSAEKLISCHRAGRPADSRVQKALKLAEGDEVLRRKLSVQTAFDEQIAETIRCVQPPGRRRGDSAEEGAAPRKEKLSAQLGTAPMLAALAGVILIIGLVVYFQMEYMRAFPGREAVARMLGTTNDMSGVELEPFNKPAPAGQLADWFFMRGFDGFSVPAELATLPAVGSRVFRQDGKPIAQLAIDQRQSLLYVFRASDFAVTLPDNADWQIVTQLGWTAALRRAGDNCAMIAFRGGEGEMLEFVRTLSKK